MATTNAAGNIPAENVLFIGGHESFVSKMKKIYPGWTYLNPSERNCNKVKGDYTAIVIKFDHVSHNIIERALSFCKGTPIIYSRCTNLNRSLDEISTGFQKITLKA